MYTFDAEGNVTGTTGLSEAQCEGGINASAGGAAGTFVGIENLDVEMTFEGTRQIGASLGSGSVIVFSDNDLIIYLT